MYEFWRGANDQPVAFGSFVQLFSPSFFSVCWLIFCFPSRGHTKGVRDDKGVCGGSQGRVREPENSQIRSVGCIRTGPQGNGTGVIASHMSRLLCQQTLLFGIAVDSGAVYPSNKTTALSVWGRCCTQCPVGCSGGGSICCVSSPVFCQRWPIWIVPTGTIA